jgi:hypothetical protein
MCLRGRLPLTAACIRSHGIDHNSLVAYQLVLIAKLTWTLVPGGVIQYSDCTGLFDKHVESVSC